MSASKPIPPRAGPSVRLLRSAGFTLLELLVVMTIIGLLAGYVGPKFFAHIGKSEIKAARAQIDGFEKALDQFRLDMGRYPSTEEGLAALMNKPAGDTGKWSGPYLKKATLPAEPINNIATVEIVTTGALGMTASGTTGGWKFDNKTGQLIVNIAAYQSR